MAMVAGGRLWKGIRRDKEGERSVLRRGGGAEFLVQNPRRTHVGFF